MHKILYLLPCLLLSSLFSDAQFAGLKGRITTADQQPIHLITVRLLNSKHATSTDVNGFYELKAIQAGTYTLEVSYTGDVKATQNIELAAGQTRTLNFSISQTAKQLDEVTVETVRIISRAGATANKLPLTNMETPQIVHSISDVVLRKQIAMTLEDAMKNGPGITKLWDATSRPDGGSIFVSRGFPTTTKARNGLSNIVNTNVEMANLDHIEIIKGPSATLFGSLIGSYGGIINRVTKKPFFHNGGFADLAYGSYNFYRGSVDYNFVINKDVLAARINAAGQHQDSWQDAGFQQSYIIAPSLLYQPNDRLRVNLDAEIVGTRGNSNGGNFMFILNPSMVNAQLTPMVAGALQQQGVPQENIDAILAQIPQTFEQAFGTNKVQELDLDYNRSFLNNDLYPQTRSNAVFADATYRFSPHWSTQTVATYSNSVNKGYSVYQYLIPNYIYSLATTLSPGAAGADSLSRQVWNPDGHTHTFNFQQNISSDYKFGVIRNRAVAGFDLAKYTSNVVYHRFTGALHGIIPFPDAFDVVDAKGQSPRMGDFTKANVEARFAANPTEPLVYDQQSTILSGYLNNITNITDYVIVAAGVRVDRFRDDVLAQSQTKWSPKFGLILMPVKNKLTLFANWQNSFTNQFGTDQAGHPFDPEEANQKELGIKYNLFNSKISGSLSYYDILARNIIRTDPSNPLFSIQDGAQKSKGLEAELVANPARGWTLLFGYGYNDSKFLKAESDVEGLRPVGSGPLNTYNIWSNYTFTESALQGLGIGIGLNHGGESFAFNLRPDGALILPAYTILSAHLTYDTPKYRVGVKANNITDQQYWMGWSNIVPQMRRQLIGSIAYKF